MKGRSYSYTDLTRRYERLSHENTMRLRKKETVEAYEKARRREVLIQKAFFSDCRRYLTEDDF